MRVFVYYNLHKHLWSIKALEGPEKGRVIAHARYVTLDNVKPKVSEAGRQRVLRERRKNVHAGLVGTWVTGSEALGRIHGPVEPITYNPYKYTGFVYKASEEPYAGSQWAMLANRSVVVA